MIYVGPFTVSQKIVKDTVKGTQYEITAGDPEGNKFKIIFDFSNFSEFKKYSVGDEIDPGSFEWQSTLEKPEDGNK